MHSLRILRCRLRKKEKSKSSLSQEKRQIICHLKKEICAAQTKDDRQRQLQYSFLLAETYYSLELYAHVITYSKRSIDIAKAVADRPSELKAYYLLVKTYDVMKEYHADAIYYSREYIELAEEINEKKHYLRACYLLVKAYGLLNQYDSALIYAKKYLQYAKETGDKESELKAYHLLVLACDLLKQYNATTASYCEKCIDITEETGDMKIKLNASLVLVKTYEYLQQYDEVAILYCKKCLDILEETDNNNRSELKACYLLGKAYVLLEQYDDAIPYMKRCIEIAENVTNTESEMKGYYVLRLAYNFIGKYEKAIACSRKSISGIAEEIGNHEYKMESCLQLAEVFSSKKNYEEAVIYYIKYIVIAQQIGDKSREMDGAFLLSNVYYLKEQYDEAINYCTKCAEIARRTDDKKRLAKTYLLLGKVYFLLNKYRKAIAHSRKYIRMEQFAGKQDEIDAYSILVEAQCYINEYDDAITNGERCIRRVRETEQKHGLTNVYHFLGKASYSLRRYDDAIKYCKKCIDTAKHNGDTPREVEGCLLLANLFYEYKRYEDAIVQTGKCIHMANQEGEKLWDMEAHLLAGKSYFSLKRYEEANRDVKKCIKMAQETGHLKFELEARILDARLFLAVGSKKDIVSAIAQSLVLAEDLQDSSAKESVLEIIFTFLEQQEHDKNSMTEFSEPTAYQTVEKHSNLGRETEMIENIENLIVLHEIYIHQVRNDQFLDAIATLQQIVDIDFSSMKVFLKSFCYQRIGCLYLSLEQSEEGISQLLDAMNCAKEVGSAVIKNNINLKCSRKLGVAYFKNGKTEKSIRLLTESISCIDFFVKTMHESDENTIIDFIDKVNDCYNYLAKGLIKMNRIQEALLVLEQRTARALKEQLISRHEITKECHEEHMTYDDIKSLVSRNKYSILFCSVFPDCLYTFLIEKGSGLQFWQYPSPTTDTERSIKAMLESFATNEKNRMLSGIESDINVYENDTCNIEQDLSKAVGRILGYFGSSPRSRTTGEPCESIDPGSITNDLELLYHKLFGKMSIKQDEIVIIPDGPLYKVPFAALRDPDTGQYLSETKRIRIAPSITTLKLLQEIPDDRCRNPSLVVGNPLVGEVILGGKKRKVRPLSAAFREANAVSKILNVMPLTGENATKPAVIERLQRELSVVHIAAHACCNNGTIALAPTPETRREMMTPVEKDYVLTMTDVQRAQVCVLLVVLSCCYTGGGKIRAEGLVGMCRAFLASGARAVVASLWAIHDQATFEFMERFYQHIEAGERASTSLHHTMKEMRQIEKYTDPKYWAPFFLMGDDVAINF